MLSSFFLACFLLFSFLLISLYPLYVTFGYTCPLYNWNYFLQEIPCIFVGGSHYNLPIRATNWTDSVVAILKPYPLSLWMIVGVLIHTFSLSHQVTQIYKSSCKMSTCDIRSILLVCISSIVGNINLEVYWYIWKLRRSAIKILQYK